MQHDLFIHFKEGLVALGMEEYKGFIVLYFQKADKTCLYNIIINGELNQGVAETKEAVIELAHKDLNEFLNTDGNNQTKTTS